MYKVSIPTGRLNETKLSVYSAEGMKNGIAHIDSGEVTLANSLRPRGFTKKSVEPQQYFPHRQVSHRYGFEKN
jgi:hypothetical protein